MKSIKVLLAVVSLVLLSSCAFAQMSIDRISGFDYEINQKKTSRFPSYSLVFNYNVPAKEDVFLSIKSDSINPNVVSSVLFGFMPLSLNVRGMSIYLVFEDGTKEEFRQIFCDKENYCEFELTQKTYNKIHRVKFKYIEIGNLGKFKDFFQDTSFFMDFFKILDKG
jgi:hypothetical protein